MAHLRNWKPKSVQQALLTYNELKSAVMVNIMKK